MARKTKETKVVNYIPLIKDYYFSADDNQYILYQKNIRNKIEFGTKKVLDEMVENMDIIGYYTITFVILLILLINKEREYNMPFSYKPLWKKLIDNDMTKKELMESIPISKSTIDKMGRGENVSLEIVDKICNFFNCPITDVIKHIEKEKDI